MKPTNIERVIKWRPCKGSHREIIRERLNESLQKPNVKERQEIISSKNEELYMVAQAYNPSPWEVEARGLTKGHPGLPSKVLAMIT